MQMIRHISLGMLVCTCVIGYSHAASLSMLMPATSRLSTNHHSLSADTILSSKYHNTKDFQNGSTPNEFGFKWDHRQRNIRYFCSILSMIEINGLSTLWKSVNIYDHHLTGFRQLATSNTLTDDIYSSDLFFEIQSNSRTYIYSNNLMWRSNHDAFDCSWKSNKTWYEVITCLYFETLSLIPCCPFLSHFSTLVSLQH